MTPRYPDSNGTNQLLALHGIAPLLCAKVRGYARARLYAFRYRFRFRIRIRALVRVHAVHRETIERTLERIDFGSPAGRKWDINFDCAAGRLFIPLFILTSRWIRVAFLFFWFEYPCNGSFFFFNNENGFFVAFREEFR